MKIINSIIFIIINSLVYSQNYYFDLNRSIDYDNEYSISFVSSTVTGVSYLRWEQYEYEKLIERETYGFYLSNLTDYILVRKGSPQSILSNPNENINLKTVTVSVDKSTYDLTKKVFHERMEFKELLNIKAYDCVVTILSIGKIMGLKMPHGEKITPLYYLRAFCSQVEHPNYLSTTSGEEIGCKKNGDYYIGNFSGTNEDDFTGFLKQTDEEGTIIIGEFNQGFQTGASEEYYKNGDYWYSDVTTGESYYLKASGTIIYNYIDDGSITKGEILYWNGDRYIGEIKETYPHGNGWMINKNGVSYYANFNYGNRLEFVPVQMAYGKYAGNFYNGVCDGNGKYWYNNGIIYEGNFKYGTFNGEGTIFYPDKSIYKGNFSNGIMTNAQVWLSNGAYFEGSWINGVFVQIPKANTNINTSFYLGGVTMPVINDSPTNKTTNEIKEPKEPKEPKAFKEQIKKDLEPLCFGLKAQVDAGKYFQEKVGYNPYNLEKTKFDGIREAYCGNVEKWNEIKETKETKETKENEKTERVTKEPGLILLH